MKKKKKKGKMEKERKNIEMVFTSAKMWEKREKKIVNCAHSQQCWNNMNVSSQTLLCAFVMQSNW